MSGHEVSRRSFVARVLGGAGASLVVGSFPYAAEAYAHASGQQQSAEPAWLFFSRDQGAEIAAVCEQIIPSDDTPGAREAGAVYFIDFALSRYEPENQALYAEGLRQLAEAAKKRGAERFSALSPADQTAALTELEKTEFFGTVRRHTILGFLGDPRHKGNRNEVGWKHIGFEVQPMYTPPFGYYDRELLKKDG
jgi:gluconate 2-dehydrogenase gamma chain